MATIHLSQDAAALLLDFNKKLDINLLDNVVAGMYTGNKETQKVAHQALTKLKEHPEAWTRVDGMLEFSNSPHTKYFALQILEEVIKTRWKCLERQQREGIKKYIVQLIIKTSGDQESLERSRTFLNKLNVILVQVLKREWPRNWGSFIPEILGASRANDSLCENNMIILKLLSEELFDFSSGNITQTKAKYLKDTMCSEFSAIFHSCQFVLESSQNPSLIIATLETLLKFLNWIPLGYIFETKLITTLIFKFLTVPLFRNVTLKCLTEIAGVKITNNYDDTFTTLFIQTMTQLEKILPLSTDIKTAYAKGLDEEQNFIQNLAIFLCTFLKEHKQVAECQKSPFKDALGYLVLMSEVEEVEIFKICLEYWSNLASQLYRDIELQHVGVPAPPLSSLTQTYQEVLNKVRFIMISRMAKPEEVLVVENDNGEVVREFMQDTDAINLYKNMRETLVYLTHLDYTNTERVMTSKLKNQVDGSEWSWKNLNTLCWAIGSISGAMHKEDENRFLITVMKDLLSLCEHKSGKDNKAIIASNIMYVVGQYPRFLRANWKFLKTVVNKLFEFMHETHDGVQDMACDTFIKIAMKCRQHFVVTQISETAPFIEEILPNMRIIISDLQPQQLHTFYEAVGYIISAEVDQPRKKALIDKYMLLPNQVWDEIIKKVKKNFDCLKEIEVIKLVAVIMKTNVRACKALNHAYVYQLGKVYVDMLSVYKIVSENITAAMSLNGEEVAQLPLIKTMRVVKKEILKLIADWISRSNDDKIVLENFVPPFMSAVLLDYQRTTVPSAREPEVLSAMATMVNKLKGNINLEVPKILDAVFECTLEMISKNFEEFPEHRANFFLVLQAINCHCFLAFLNISPTQFKLVLDSIIWAFKHTMRNVAELGLQILLKMLQNMELHETAALIFYQTYLTDILRNVLEVTTDSSHSARLGTHATILAYIFSLVESGRVNCQLGPTPDNILFIKEYTASLLKSAFPRHLSDNQVKVIVQGMFSLNQDLVAFKEHLRDFLVQIREYIGEDDSDLFLEEREIALRSVEAEKRRVQLSVPGIVNPHEMPEDMQE
ncbi:unnamed protein product [Ceutorhynchus assimilis]|uniref:Exportin-1 n=1 Tax=Ceutorhynchus assimilis TaxID=467358 RepID=A0A9P0GYA0_9CUCU|nr:unnamed protein product [Ceutorhynchus assimilis]